MTLRALAFALAYLVLPAAAHDFWLDHSRVDPRTKLYCCGENDCHLLPVSQAHATKGGYLLDDTSETISWDRVQSSPDGGIWACRWGCHCEERERRSNPGAGAANVSRWPWIASLRSQ
jgi:hypothetical protein